MGKYYLFKVSLDVDESKKIFRPVEDNETEYINYNKYLNNCYGESIIDNEDYITLKNKQSAYMILREDCFEKTDLENVFEVLYDNLYMNRGEEFEENNNCEWSSKIG